MKRIAFGAIWLLGSVSLVLGAQAEHPKAAGDAMQVKLDNERVRVVEYTSGPGGGVCGAGKHSHLDHVTYFLTPAKIKIVGADGKAATVSFKKDDVIWSKAETHFADNVGAAPSRLILVEVKK